MFDVQVREGSLTAGDETVWVNASNTQLALGSGVSGAIRRACRPTFQGELDALVAKNGGSFEPGAVVATHGGGGKAQHIVHVAVMDYRDGTLDTVHPSLDRIRLGCEAMWDLIDQLPARPLTVAMVALGAGTGGLGLRDSVRVACETLRAHRAIHTRSPVTRVTFYGYSLHEYLATAAEVVRHFPVVADALPADVKRALEGA